MSKISEPVLLQLNMPGIRAHDPHNGNCKQKNAQNTQRFSDLIERGGAERDGSGKPAQKTDQPGAAPEFLQSATLHYNLRETADAGGTPFAELAHEMAVIQSSPPVSDSAPPAEATGLRQTQEQGMGTDRRAPHQSVSGQWNVAFASADQNEGIFALAHRVGGSDQTVQKWPANALSDTMPADRPVQQFVPDNAEAVSNLRRLESHNNSHRQPELKEQMPGADVLVPVLSIENAIAPSDPSAGAQIAHALSEAIHNGPTSGADKMSVSVATTHTELTSQSTTVLPVRTPMRTIVLELHPESLGAVRLNFRFSGETLRLRVEVAQPGSLAAVVSAQDEIGALLHRQGVVTDEITFVTSSTVPVKAVQHADNVQEGSGPEDAFFSRNHESGTSDRGGNERGDGGRRPPQYESHDPPTMQVKPDRRDHHPWRNFL